ncbi:hypothetical protein GIB67_040232 [Kingdonia uniflora]|uniref:Uncharacterized protein n=1 Tax=Kingdonia uniflora TaxID=39325 RepID=A0A7J7MVJ9_9MAGN|nr:hypothetical protein GIB67_040232 [Kingdonia uniflora]
MSNIIEYQRKKKQGNCRPCDHKYKITFKWDIKSTMSTKLYFNILIPDVDNFKDCSMEKHVTSITNATSNSPSKDELMLKNIKTILEIKDENETHEQKDKDDSSQTTINSKVNQIDAIGSEEAPNYKLKKRKLRKIIYDDRDGKWTLALS